MKHHLTLAALAFCGSVLIAPSASAQTKVKAAPKAKSAPKVNRTQKKNNNYRLREYRIPVIGKKDQKAFVWEYVGPPRKENEGSPMMIKPDDRYVYLGFNSSK